MGSPGEALLHASVGVIGDMASALGPRFKQVCRHRGDDLGEYLGAHLGPHLGEYLGEYLGE